MLINNHEFAIVVDLFKFREKVSIVLFQASCAIVVELHACLVVLPHVHV